MAAAARRLAGGAPERPPPQNKRPLESGGGGGSDAQRPRRGLQAAARELGQSLGSADARRAWVEDARVLAIGGSAPRALGNMLSAARARAAFSEEMLDRHGPPFPPYVQGLCAWSMLFRLHRTFANYLGKLRMVCDLLQVSPAALADPAVKRATLAVAKREPPPAPRLGIGQKLVGQLADNALADGDEASCMLYRMAYTFLLRVPSEGLPVMAAGAEALGRPLAPGQHSALVPLEDRLVLVLARRKNRPHGSSLVRECTCAAARKLCPVHRLGAWLQRCRPGARPFAHISPGWATAELRRRLRALRVPQAELHSLHGFRRGRARDILRANGRLIDVLRAGEWASSAFAKYLDAEEVEAGAEVEAYLVESESD